MPGREAICLCFLTSFSSLAKWEVAAGFFGGLSRRFSPLSVMTVTTVKRREVIYASPREWGLTVLASMARSSRVIIHCRQWSLW